MSINASVGAVAAAGGLESWSVRRLAFGTHRSLHQRGHRRQELFGALPQELGALHHSCHSRSGRHTGWKTAGPLESFQANRRSLNLVGYEGVAIIAVSGVDMAIWDALAKAADLPLAA